MDYFPFDAGHEIEHAIADTVRPVPRGVVRLRASQAIGDRVAARALLLAQAFGEYVELAHQK